MTLAIQQSEYEERLAALAEHLLEHRLTGAVLFDPYYVLYYAGFAFAPTERPIAFVLNAEGKGGILVPRLEREHAQANASVDHVADYPEYPSETHPTESLRELLEEMGVTGSFGADQDGYPWVLGYRGPTLTELTGTTPERITAFVEDQMAVKSPAEIALIRESSKWGNLAHVLLHRNNASCSTTWSRCRTPRSRRSSPARGAPTSTERCARTTTSMISGSTGSITSAIASGCATTRARSSTSATTRRSSQGWCSQSSLASTRPASEAFGTRTPWP